MNSARLSNQNISKSDKTPRLYTLEEYLTREEQTIDKHEFYNGQIIKLPNSKFYHNLIGQSIIPTRAVG